MMGALVTGSESTGGGHGVGCDVDAILVSSQCTLHVRQPYAAAPAPPVPPWVGGLHRVCQVRSAGRVLHLLRIPGIVFAHCSRACQQARVRDSHCSVTVTVVSFGSA